MSDYKKYVLSYFLNMSKNRELSEELANSMMKSEQRIYSFISMEAKDRYMFIMKEQPELIKMAKQEHIASYLGITPSSLSRIKRNL